MAKGLNILITFKKEEKWLYDYISKNSCKSAYVKDFIKNHLTAEEIQKLKNAK